MCVTRNDIECFSVICYLAWNGFFINIDNDLLISAGVPQKRETVSFEASGVAYASRRYLRKYLLQFSTFTVIVNDW